MTKKLALPLLALLVGCTPQQKTVLIADFRNACAYPVNVDVYAYSNAKEPFSFTRRVMPGETIEVLSYISFESDIRTGTPDSYTLTVTANGQQIKLNKSGFLDNLTTAKIGAHGSAVDIWVVDTKRLCT